MSALTDRLDEYAALADAATEGPWHPGRGRTHRYVMGPVYSIAETGVVDGMPDESVAAIERDTEFIAASRTALPTLIEALRSVLALHAERATEFYGMTECARCSDDATEVADGERVAVPYPCDTVKAIASALEVEP